MADSLVISGTIELLGGGVPSANPLCPGAMFRLQPGADPGAPQPTTDFVASLLLDGERPFGRRASNRTITLPIWITAPNRQILAAAREVLQQTVDQDMFTITWTRDPGLGGTPLPMILDCYRAQPSKPTFATWLEVQTTGMQIELTIPARPYGRSDVQTQIAFAAPVPASPPAPPSAVTIDNFLTIATTQCARSSQCVVGPWSAMWDPDDPVRVGDPGGQSTPFIYAATLPAPLNLSGLTTLQMQIGLGTRYFTNLDYHHRSSGVQIAGFLSDSSGNQLPLSRSNMLLPCTPNYAQPIFSRVTIPIPQGNPLFNYSSVIAYSLTITNRQYPVERLAWVTCYLDNLTAQPPSISVSPATRGYVYRLTSVAGTARAELSLTFTQPPTAGTPTTVTSAGAGSYTTPAGTAWLDVQGWGGGGAGASVNTAGQGGGGAGAEYTRNTQFPASPGQVIPYAVGSGGTAGSSPVPGTATVFGPGPSSSTVLTANGGTSAAFNSPAGQAGASGSGDPIEYPGGAGHTASGGLAGGGGSSAGPSAPGNAPVGTGSVTFASSSSFVCPNGVTQVYVECWAPGGSGGCGNGSFSYGAGGAAGEYRAGYVKVTPGLSYPFTIATGGSAVTGSNANGNAGSGATSFTGDNRTISANPGAGGLGGQFSRTGGGSPGSGGSGDVGFSGGRGGNAYPYTGGGGSGAGPGSSGNAGGNPGGGIAPPQGGNGGDGSGTGGGSGHPGSVPSGGGGGCFNGTGNSSGAGANGQIRITYPNVSGAPTNAGGIAVSGGGAGGQGGATAGQAGSAGSAPGGAGGGANSGGTSVAGGSGAAGQLVVTPFGAQPVNALIVHKPPTGAIKTYQPLIPVGAGADAPDGSHQYPVPQPQVGVNAGFYGTYTIYLIAAGLAGASNSLHTIQVTFTQFEFAGGGSYTVSTTPVTVTPAQVTNGVITAGVLTLPIMALAADNTSASYSVSVTSTNTSDRFYDLLALDTQGSTVVVNIPTGSGYPVFYIDPPDPNYALGQVLGSWGGRGQAVSVSGYPGNVISGPPMFVDPLDGDSILFAYVPDGVAPAVGGSYFAHYYYDRPS